MATGLSADGQYHATYQREILITNRGEVHAIFKVGVLKLKLKFPKENIAKNALRLM